MIAKDCHFVHRPLYSAANAFRVTWSERIFFTQIRHRNASTEIAWEDAVQGLGMVMSNLASEKNRELLQGVVVYRQCVLQLHLCVLFH